MIRGFLSSYLYFGFPMYPVPKCDFPPTHASFLVVLSSTTPSAIIYYIVDLHYVPFTLF